MKNPKSPILVTGGTGTLGRHVVTRLRDAGCEVRVLTRSSRPSEGGIQFVTGDLVRGDRIEPAIDRVAAILHCASDTKGDVEATRNLVRAAASRPRPPHFVFISIVGVETLSWGYLRSKLEAEQVVADSGLPWTILRATQFYDFILSGAQRMAKLPVIPVPSRFRVQPIDPDDVAARLVELELGDPAGRVPDLGGPQVSTWDDMLRVYLRARHRRRLIVPVRIPGTGRVRAGGLLPTQPAGAQAAGAQATGSRTWEEFLADNSRPVGIE
jgi:uncharacterized protein YbjT (DUF2867 family)